MKNVLFVSSTTSVFHAPLWKAFEYFGYRVHFVDYRGHPFVKPGNLIHRALHRAPSKLENSLHSYAYSHIDKQILRTAHTVRPDLVFMSKAKYISLPVLDELRTLAPTVNWYVDNMSNEGTIRKVTPHYDFVFNYDRYVVDFFRKEGNANIYHLPWCGYLGKNATWPDREDYQHDVVFIGTYHPEIFPRDAELGGLKGLGLKIWGRGWDKNSLKACWQGTLPPVAEKIQGVYRKSKMAIYYDSLYDLPGTGITLRPFEITAAGAMMLGNVSKAEFPELFEYGKEVVPFNDAKSLASTISYYLSNEDERREIARAGFERTRNDHTYYDRVGRILDIVSGKIND